MIEIVTVYPDHKRIVDATRKGYMPWECIRCRQLMVKRYDETRAYCTNCGMFYYYYPEDPKDTDQIQGEA